MFINVEPAGFFMYTVKLVFDLERPDTEDQAVRDYLADHKLEPRYKYETEPEARRCEVLQFGGCYLGRHLQSVGQIQRHAVEVELLTAEVESHLSVLAASDTGRLASLDVKRWRTMVAALVTDFHQESAFQPDENGELAAMLDGATVRAAALRRLAVGG